MSISNIPLMKAMAAKMDYLDKRQQILSQNIANADTPNYQSKDLTEVDFGAVLKNVTRRGKLAIDSTHAGHMPSPGQIDRSREAKDRMTYEVAPDRNGVILEEQMVKATKTQMDYNLLTNLMTKQSSMYRTAIGRNGG